jgi:hypothetical protein
MDVYLTLASLAEMRFGLAIFNFVKPQLAVSLVNINPQQPLLFPLLIFLSNMHPSHNLLPLLGLYLIVFSLLLVIVYIYD